LTPSFAAVPEIETIFVEAPDLVTTRLGVKGIGELPMVGVAAAIANAVYHTTGIRVRDLPIRLDKLLV
jgi:xanthine dehydrogenase YagR molybdenum-binding subunit